MVLKEQLRSLAVVLVERCIVDCLCEILNLRQQVILGGHELVQVASDAVVDVAILVKDDLLGLWNRLGFCGQSFQSGQISAHDKDSSISITCLE